MDPVIEIIHVTKDFGGEKGVFDINFSVPKGEVFGYLGPNGAGKSTTIRQMMGFIRPQKGACRILGKDCFRNAAEVQNHVGYLAGELSFIDDMTGMEYIDFIAQMKGIKDQTTTRQLIDRFEFDPKVKIRKMSKGMKQKTGLVVAFMGNPEVLILDEPTSGLDPLMQNRFIELILEEKKKGATIFMSSHLLEEVDKTCDRTAIIRQGRIADTVEISSLSKLKSKVYTVTLANRENAAKLGEEKTLHIKQVRGNIVDLFVNDNVSAVLKVISLYEPVSLEIASESLEELFLRYYGEERMRNA